MVEWDLLEELLVTSWVGWQRQEQELRVVERKWMLGMEPEIVVDPVQLALRRYRHDHHRLAA